MCAYPRLRLSLDAVAGNSRRLAATLRDKRIALVGVTKAVDGEPAVGRAMLDGGAVGLADSRLPALARLAGAGLGPLTFIRAPQRGELETLAAVADRVMLSDLATIRALGERAGDAPVEVLLTADFGDRREGVLPDAVPALARAAAATQGIRLVGIGVNYACLSGLLPSVVLFRAAEDLLERFAGECAGEPVLSLGGTCCVQHVEGWEPRFATEIRSGGGPLYGHDFVSGRGIAGMTRTDPVLAAEVLECSKKPPAPVGLGGYDAFGHVPEVDLPGEEAWYALLCLGRRDCEPRGLRPLVDGSYLAGATSDVSVLVTPRPLRPGDTVDFAADYEALVRAVTSPYVVKEFAPRAADPEGVA